MSCPPPKTNSDKVLRPSGPEETGLQLSRISGMTFNHPQGEEEGCNYANQHSVWDKEAKNLPGIRQAT